MLGFYFEDAELGGVVMVLGLFAEGAFGQAGASTACGYELAGKLDEIGRNLDGRLDGLEYGSLAEGDLFVEEEGFIRVGGDGDARVVVFDGFMGRSGGGGTAGSVGVVDGVVEADIFGEADGEVGGGEGGAEVELRLSLGGWRLGPCKKCRSLRQAQGRLFESLRDEFGYRALIRRI